MQQFKTLEIKDASLWEKMTEFVIEERYAGSLKESVKAMEGLTYYHEILDKESIANQNFLGKNTPRSGGVIQALTDRSKSKNMIGTYSFTEATSTDSTVERKRYLLKSRKSKALNCINKLGQNIIRRMRDENQQTLNSLASSLHKLSPMIKNSPEVPILDELYSKLDQ